MRARAWKRENYGRAKRRWKNARASARVNHWNRQYRSLPARRLCGRFGADYGFVLSLIPVSYGQQFTGYHRTAINLGVSSRCRCSRGCGVRSRRGDRWDSSHIKLPGAEWNIVCKAWSVRMTRRRRPRPTRLTMEKSTYTPGRLIAGPSAVRTLVVARLIRSRREEGAVKRYTRGNLRRWCITWLKKGEAMDRCARLEVWIERKWKLRTGFIIGWEKRSILFLSPPIFNPSY